MTRKTTLVWSLLAVAALGVLITTGDRPASGETQSDESVIKSLMEADAAWFSTLDDPAAFMAFLADDVCFMPPDGPRSVGAMELRSTIEQVLQLPGVKLTWKADEANASAGGDLGYTIGSTMLTLDGPDGQPISRAGKYQTTWQRSDEGGWKVVADIFNFDAPAP